MLPIKVMPLGIVVSKTFIHNGDLVNFVGVREVSKCWYCALVYIM